MQTLTDSLSQVAAASLGIHEEVNCLSLPLEILMEQELQDAIELAVTVFSARIQTETEDSFTVIFGSAAEAGAYIRRVNEATDTLTALRSETINRVVEVSCA